MVRKAIPVILAVSLLVLAVSAAAAEGTGLFRELIDTECTDDRLADLDAAAETISVSRTTGSVTVEVSQAYYEGNRVYISYRAVGPAGIQDGLSLEDGEYADIIAGGEVQLEDGSVIGWKECVVPEDETADTQTFLLEYRTSGSKEKESVRFTLDRHACDLYLRGVSDAGGCSATAILYRGKIDIKGMVRITSPEQAASWIAWQEGADETGTDVIACWNLYQNGELVTADLYGASEVTSETDVVFGVMYPYLDDLSNLMLVPEYSEAGEKPEEAIALTVETPEQGMQ